MVLVKAAALIEPTAAQLSDVAEVFDEYRQHYAQPVVPGQTLVRLIDHAGHGRLTVFTAHKSAKVGDSGLNGWLVIWLCEPDRA